MLPSHEQALEQLRELEHTSSGRFRVVATRLVNERSLRVELTVWCGDLEQRPGGLPLRDRERFIISISDAFPYEPPTVDASHKRFAGFAHVQWRHHVCLYQSVETEWSPRDGMFGFLTRLVLWLEHGAKGEFEPEGAPLHPPVAYERSSATIVPRADTPNPDGVPWIGLAHLRMVHDARADVVGWGALFEPLAEGLHAGVAILLDRAMPFEYPAKLSELFELLADRGVASRFGPLLAAASRNPAGTPLYVLVGTPMRGVSGAAHRRQHLAAWRVDSATATTLHELMASDKAETEQLATIVAWAAESKVEWVTVREARAEVTRRRDEGAAMEYFAGRAVALWGCGALGGHIAELLARAGVRRLVLRDRALVAPGVLVRQPFEDREIGYGKAACMAARVKRIDPQIEVTWSGADILTDPLDNDDWSDGADVVIDASASLAVLEKLELRRKTATRRIPIVNVVVDGRAERALLTIAHAAHTGGPADVTRRAKLEACNRASLREFADAFWPNSRPPVFQPEPGCSASTFRGSAADLVVLAATSLNIAAVDLARPLPEATAVAHFVTQPHVQATLGRARETALTWSPDVVSEDEDSGYSVRIAAGAWRELGAWSSRSARVRGSNVETGGVLFGERNDACRVVWVDEVLGPPRDSRAGPDRFECGVAGVLAAQQEKRDRSRQSVDYIGMWHTHPDAEPVPSETDRDGMRRLTSIAGGRAQKALLVILSTRAGRPVRHGAYLFSRARTESNL